MKNHGKRFLCLAAGLLFFAGVLFLGAGEVVANQDFHSWPTQEKIEPAKTWTITFSESVAEHSVGEDTVYVACSEDNKFDVKRVVHDNKVKVSPADGLKYSYGETYTLWVMDVEAADGTQLKQNIKMDFTIIAEDEEDTVTFAVDDFAIYDMHIELDGEHLHDFLYQWEVMEITAQHVTFCETSKLDSYSEVEIGPNIHYSRWNPESRANMGYASEKDGNFIEPEEILTSILWIPADTVEGEEQVLADLPLQAQGPVTIELPGLEEGIEAWKFQKEVEQAQATFYYSTEEGLLLKLVMEDDHPDRRDLYIELSIADSNIFFAGSGDASSMRAAVCAGSGAFNGNADGYSQYEDEVNTVMAKGNTVSQLQSGGSLFTLMGPPYTETIVPMESTSNIRGREGEFFDNRVNPQQDGNIFLRTSALVTLAAGAEAKPWGTLRQKVYVCDEEGETGPYKISFFCDYDVDVVLASTASLGDVQTKIETEAYGHAMDLIEGKRPDRLKRLFKMLKSLTPKNTGRVGVQITAAAYDEQGVEIAQEKEWVHALPPQGIYQSQGIFPFSDSSSGNKRIDLDVDLEAGQHYYLDLKVESWLYLSAMGTVVQIGEIDGYVKLASIRAEWDKCDPIFIPDSDGCPVLRIDTIPDQAPDEPFDVTVSLETPEGTPWMINEDSNLHLSLEQGQGNLGGTTNKVLPAHHSQVVFENVTYDQTDKDVILKVVAEECPLKKLEASNSNPFDVKEGTAHVSASCEFHGIDAWNCSGLEGEWQFKLEQTLGNPYNPLLEELIGYGEGAFTMPSRPEVGPWESEPFTFILRGAVESPPGQALWEVEMLCEDMVATIIEQGDSLFLNIEGTKRDHVFRVTIYDSGWSEEFDQPDGNIEIHPRGEIIFDHHPSYCECS